MMINKVSVYDFLSTISESQLLVILEGFRVATNDADIYDSLVEQMDLSDEEMFEIRKTVQFFLDEDSDD